MYEFQINHEKLGYLIIFNDISNNNKKNVNLKFCFQIQKQKRLFNINPGFLITMCSFPIPRAKNVKMTS